MSGEVRARQNRFDQPVLSRRRHLGHRKHLLDNAFRRLQVLLQMQRRELQVFDHIIEAVHLGVIEKTQGRIKRMPDQIADGVPVLLIRQDGEGAYPDPARVRVARPWRVRPESTQWF